MLANDQFHKIITLNEPFKPKNNCQVLNVLVFLNSSPTADKTPSLKALDWIKADKLPPMSAYKKGLDSLHLYSDTYFFTSYAKRKIGPALINILCLEFNILMFFAPN